MHIGSTSLGESKKFGRAGLPTRPSDLLLAYYSIGRTVTTKSKLIQN